MFERFTDAARQALVYAEDEARVVGQAAIGSEHLLLGLLREGTGAAATVLANRELTLEATRQEVGRVPGGDVEASDRVGLAFAADARQALDRAVLEASALGHDHIGTEHILLGVLRDEEGVAVGVLVGLGVEPPAIRAEILRLVGAGRIEGLTGGEAHTEVATPPSFTAWLGTALTAASAEATADGRAIEVTDLLLAMADDPQTPAGWVLAELGIDSQALRATAEHLRLLDREIDRVGREMHDASASDQVVRTAELRDQRRQLIAQRQRRVLPTEGADPDGPVG
ncbi:MAG: ATP-dependent Clp protease ATP-binding subunit ClpC [Solirubrobacteraceae bacterium]|jgi:ATP-dependent Clp protease ATP-binding subunit ClpA|nr:ATP-dependent Clp protease ATP-binding subunit ClpC [Solirubrobacteraceae bacterium]